jgi:non-specific serine/threonine protein kinase
MMRGEYGRATALLEECLTLSRETGDPAMVTNAIINLGLVAYRQGDYGRAATLHQDGLRISRATGHKLLVAEGLEGLAAVVRVQGQPVRAARLGGAAEALREVLGAPVPPDERADHKQAIRAMRQALGHAGFAVAWAEGRASPLEDVIALALGDTDAALQGQEAGGDRHLLA